MSTKKTSSFLAWAEKTNEETYRKADDVVRDLRQLYDEAKESLDGRILGHLESVMTEEGLSLAEAKRWMSIKDTKKALDGLDDFINQAKVSALDPALSKELRLMSHRTRISYLEAMELELKKSVARLMTKEQKKLFAHLSESYENKYYKDLYGLSRVVGEQNIVKANPKVIERTITRNWCLDGKTINDRLTEREAHNIGKLKMILGKNLATGRSLRDTTKEIAGALDRSFSSAAVLVHTETAAIIEQASMDAYKEYGIDKYQISATLDNRTSDICRDMDGRVFYTKDKIQGVNYPPFHPYCRTTTVPYFDDDIQREMDKEVGRMARHPKTGKSVLVYDVKDYGDWYGKYVNPTFKEVSKEFIESKETRGEKIENLPKSMYEKMGFKKDYRLVFDHKGEEKEIAQWLADEIGGEVYLCPRVELPKKVKTPDYIWDQEKWDLKGIHSHGKNTINTAINNTRNQSNNVVLNLIDSSYTDVNLLKEMQRIFSNPRYSYIEKILVLEKFRLRKVFKRT